MKLDEDLQRILNVGAKIYNTKSGKQGKVDLVDNSIVSVDYGNSAKHEIVEYPTEEFKQKLVDDEIVANYRLTIGAGNKFKVLSRQGDSKPVERSTKSKKPKSKEPKLEIGYINFKTGRFSKESKRGYTKVEYKKSVQKVELEVDEDQLRKLKELGLV